MRVLEVCQPTDGGVAHHALVLSAELRARGWEVTVACPPGALPERLAAAGVPWVELPMGRSVAPADDARATRALARHLREARRRGSGYDLVHTHSSKAGAVGRAAAWASRVPALYTPHAWSFLSSDRRAEAALYRLAELALTVATRQVICVSSAERDLGRRVGAGRKTTVVPNGVDPAPPAIRPRGAPGQVVVGTVARLARQKGIDLLLDAAERVCATRPDVTFRVAGDGPLAGELRADAARRGLADRVRFDGAVAGPWETLSRIDVFALPSRWEGMPYALLEAMSAGLPTVSFDVGGVRDLVPDPSYGRVVAPGDTDGLAAALLELAGDADARRRIGTAARRRVLDEFTVERMVDRTEDVYRAAIGTRPRAHVADARPPSRGQP